MKPKRFEIGQAVTLRKRSRRWRKTSDDSPTRFKGNFPSFGKVYHVHSYYTFFNGEWFISLREINGKASFYEDAFDPIISTKGLMDELVDIGQEASV
jgi:hypothetical protein